MNNRKSKAIAVGCLSALLVMWPVIVTHAGLTMEEVHYLFNREKGKSWAQATTQERKEFLGYLDDIESIEILEKDDGQRDVVIHKKKKTALVQQKIIESEDIKKRTAPYIIRKSFKNETGKDWEDASEEQRVNYWEQYTAKEANWKEQEIQRKQNIQNRKERIRQQKLRREEKIEQRKLRRQAKEQQKREMIEAKRQRERDNLQRSRDRLEELRQRSRRSR